MVAKGLANRAYHAAREAMARGDYDLARAALRWARRADSGNPLYIHAEAIVARRTGGHFEADRLFRRVADLAERAFGKGHIRNVAISTQMIALYEEMGNAYEAAKLRLHVIDNLDRQSAADSSIRALDRFAEICLSARRSGEAVETYEAALARRRQAFGDTHGRVEECRAALSRLRERIRMRAEAAAANQDAIGHRPETALRRGKEEALAPSF